jgi:hypothetical protein
VHPRPPCRRRHRPFPCSRHHRCHPRLPSSDRASLARLCPR